MRYGLGSFAGSCGTARSLHLEPPASHLSQPICRLGWLSGRILPLLVRVSFFVGCEDGTMQMAMSVIILVEIAAYAIDSRNGQSCLIDTCTGVLPRTDSNSGVQLARNDSSLAGCWCQHLHNARLLENCPACVGKNRRVAACHDCLLLIIIWQVFATRPASRVGCRSPICSTACREP